MVDAEYLVRVVARMRPYLRNGTLRRSRLERVLRSLGHPPEIIRPEVMAQLRAAGVVIEDDIAALTDNHAKVAVPGRPEAPVTSARRAGEHSSSAPDASVSAARFAHSDAAVAAARRRLELDRRTTRHAKILLTADEEVGLALIVRGKAGKPLRPGDIRRLQGEARKAAESLILHNQGLVHSVAQKYAPAGMTYDDVFQHGILGLIRAVELFDPMMGNKFSTYAIHWVRQAIQRGIANDSRLIRLPVHMVDRVSKVWATRTRLTVDGVPPSVLALALACELTDEQVIECLKLGPPDLLSLDEPVGDDETTLGDLVDVADDRASLESQVEAELLQEQLHAVLDTLSEREAGVISMRFGLTDGEPKTLDEIGSVYGVTRERIRQIESKTMKKLTHPSRSKALRPFL